VLCAMDVQVQCTNIHVLAAARAADDAQAGLCCTTAQGQCARAFWREAFALVMLK
jgi:hypothetical protein